MPDFDVCFSAAVKHTLTCYMATNIQNNTHFEKIPSFWDDSCSLELRIKWQWLAEDQIQLPLLPKTLFVEIHRAKSVDMGAEKSWNSRLSIEL